MLKKGFAKFTARVWYYVPFYYEDGELDGVEECETPIEIKANSLSRLAEKLYSVSDNAYDWEIFATNLEEYEEYYLNNVDIKKPYETLCNAVAYRMQEEKDFREFAIIY